VQEEVLEKYPDADLRVYAIWFNMMPSDARDQWPPDLLTDPRVVHRWDEPKAAGTWYAERAPAMEGRLTPASKWSGDVLWDTLLLYSRDARWEGEPTGLLSWGRTIVAARDDLKAEFEKLFGPSR
jgi:hypothetical protein